MDILFEDECIKQWPNSYFKVYTSCKLSKLSLRRHYSLPLQYFTYILEIKFPEIKFLLSAFDYSFLTSS